MTIATPFSWPRALGFVLVLLLMSTSLQAQTAVRDFKVKNSSNSVDRTIMLDLLRAKMAAEFEMPFKYVVNHFKVSGNFAWFQGDAQAKDGGEITLDEDGAYDCCHVECLFKKVNGKWTVLEYAAFSTDVWWEGIAERTKAPKSIFP